MLLIRTIWLMDRGFDFTDDLFYLMWAQQPSSFLYLMVSLVMAYIHYLNL